MPNHVWILPQNHRKQNKTTPVGLNQPEKLLQAKEPRVKRQLISVHHRMGKIPANQKSTDGLTEKYVRNAHNFIARK